MRKQKLKNKLKSTFKLGILIFGISLLLTNCDKEDELDSFTTEINDNNNKIEFLSPVEFERIDLFKELQTNILLSKKNSFSSKSSPETIEYIFLNEPVLVANGENKKSYTASVKREGEIEPEYDSKLLIQNIEGQVNYFLIEVSKENGDIITTNLNSSETTFSQKKESTVAGEDAIVCAPVELVVTQVIGEVNCGCNGSSSSPVIKVTGITKTICSRTASPNRNFGPTSFSNPISGVGSGATSGGEITDPNDRPIYIYEGEENCDGHGNCTPPLYWTSTANPNQLIHVNSSSNQLIEILNTISIDYDGLTNSQKEWILDSNNSNEINSILSFLNQNNKSKKAKEFAKNAVTILLNETDELVELNSFILNLNLFQDTKITFDSLFKNFENIKNSHFDNITDKPLFSNYCAINLSHALLKSGIKINSSKVTKCWGCIDKNHKNKHSIRAEELADWLLISNINGLSKVKKLNGENFRDYVSGKKGIIFFKDYWQRDSDSGTNRTGDHIDIWTGNGLASGNFFSDWFRLTFPDITESIFGTSSLYKSKEVFFWELN